MKWCIRTNILNDHMEDDDDDDIDPARTWVAFHTQTLALAPQQDPFIIADLFTEANRQIGLVVTELTTNGARVDLQTNTNANEARPLGTSMQHILTVHIPCRGSRSIQSIRGLVISKKKRLQLITSGAIRDNVPFFLQSYGADTINGGALYSFTNVNRAQLATDLRNQLIPFSKSYQTIRQILNDHANTAVCYEENVPTRFGLFFAPTPTRTHRINFAYIYIPFHENQAVNFASDAGLIGIIRLHQEVASTPFTDRDSFIHNIDTVIANAASHHNITTQSQLPQLLERLAKLV